MNPELVHFCRQEVFKRIFGDTIVNNLKTAMTPIDALDIKAEKAAEALQEAREATIDERVRDYLSCPGNELITALSDFGHQINRDELAKHLLNGDLVVSGKLFTDALFAELREIAEEEAPEIFKGTLAALDEL